MIVWRRAGIDAWRSDDSRFTVAKVTMYDVVGWEAYMLSRALIDGQHRYGRLGPPKATLLEAQRLCERQLEEVA